MFQSVASPTHAATARQMLPPKSVSFEVERLIESYLEETSGWQKPKRCKGFSNGPWSLAERLSTRSKIILRFAICFAGSN
jgi:hypothetical protein